MVEKHKLKQDIENEFPKEEIYTDTTEVGHQIETLVLTENDGDEIDYTESVKDVFHSLVGTSIYNVIESADREIIAITNVRILISRVKEINMPLESYIILTVKSVDGLYNTWQTEIEDYQGVLQEILEEKFKNSSTMSSITQIGDFSNEKHFIN